MTHSGPSVTDCLTRPKASAADAGAAMLAANINPATGLATDYLNHFNEITMLIDLVPAMPEMIGEIRHWRPVGYEEHFARSGFSAKALAIAAHRDAPRAIREALADAVAELDEAILEALDALEAAPAAAHARIVYDRQGAIRPLVGRVAGIIHGVAFDESAAPGASQVAVDALLE